MMLLKKMRKKKTLTSKRTKHIGLKHGFRSGLEEVNAQDLTRNNIPYTYEEEKIQYVKPSKNSKYTPDFIIPHRNDPNKKLIIETKGRFVPQDRQKHKLVQKQHPDLDIRFVFSNSKQRINKTSKTTYAAWCEKNGFLYADKSIPKEWLEEYGYS